MTPISNRTSDNYLLGDPAIIDPEMCCEEHSNCDPHFPEKSSEDVNPTP